MPTMSNIPAGPATPAPQTSIKITEIRIGCPDEYDRKAETAQVWPDSIWLYLLINQALYHDDDRKIAYALSYMKKGSAATWAEVHCQQGFTNQSFGTFNAFKQDFEKAFGNVNTAQEAMNWLSTTHIDSGDQLQEYINKFKLNIICAKYDKTKDATTLISYFKTGIPMWIMHYIQSMDTIPTIIIGWYDKAAHFHLQKEITCKVALMHWGTTPQTSWYENTSWPMTSHLIRDPNAMDIDALNLSPVEQSCCLRNHLCFICKQLNCSTRNHPHEETTTHPTQQEQVPAHPARNPERVRMTTSTPTPTSEEEDLSRYVKELEGKGRKPAELLHLLQLTVDANEKDEVSF